MPNSSIIAITTLNKEIYDICGKSMIETFLSYWPDEINLHIYSEDIDIVPDRRLKVSILTESIPEINGLKEIYRKLKPKDYRFDILKFANKVFSIAHATMENKVDKAFWIDADVITFNPIPIEKLDSWMPDDCYTACLIRKNAYSECGFVGYNINHPIHNKFMMTWKNLYNSTSIQFLQQWHDCVSYDFCRHFWMVKTHSLSKEHNDKLHPFIYSELGQYMDHLKGERRKQQGYSDEHPIHWWGKVLV